MTPWNGQLLLHASGQGPELGLSRAAIKTPRP